MTQIFFYHNAADRIGATAALISRAYAQRKTLLVYAPDVEVAGMLDRHLWMHPPGGFIPHVRNDSPLAGETPIVIAESIETVPHTERLFNLAPHVPSGFSRFTSLIEVVGREDADRMEGRERVKFYRDRGYEIRFFDLTEKH